MIDVGRPFSEPFADLIASLERSIRDGVEQEAVDRFNFQITRTSYELRRTAHAITRVTGLVGTAFTVFEPGVHFRFINNRIIWDHPTERPADGGRLQVEYTYLERPAGLTDFNEGSVIGTLVRATARELKLLYEQMDEAYRRAFIDHANGVALDNVVALLGLVRNPALPAEGHVTFFRKQAADQPFVIPVGTRVTDESDRSFVTTEPGSITPDPLDEPATHTGGVLTVTNRLAELLGVWEATADPATDPPLATQDTTADAPFGEDEKTITLVGAVVSPSLLVRYVAKSVTVPIVAQESGPDGNVNAGTIIIMPTPPTGIQGVINEALVSGGKAAEADDPLRQRAKFHLERLGNATLNAIKFAVLEIDGVDGVEVLDHSIDPAIPLGEVRVHYAGEVALDAVQTVVDTTRAAGILARLDQIVEVPVRGRWHVIPEALIPESAVANFTQALLDAINELDIGAPLSLRRLNALVYDIAGLADVAEAQLRGTDDLALPDPFLVERTEVIRPDEPNVEVVLLTALGIDGPSSRDGTTHTINLQLLTESGAATLQDFTLDLTITVRATLETAPDQPPVLLGSLLGQVAFSGSPTAPLKIEEADITEVGYEPDDHDQDVTVTISVAAFPGLAGTETPLTMSV